MVRLLLISALAIGLVNAQSSMTSEAKGTAVVKEAVKKVQDSGIFPNDNGFLRRIAWVESLDGTHPNTYRSGYHGGIWQVDRIGFIDTQTHPTAISKIHPKIKQKFGINWLNVQWSDLRKPFYSALAARAKLYITGSPSMCLQAIPTTVNGQAEHWKICYNTVLGAGTVQKFIDAMATMPA